MTIEDIKNLPTKKERIETIEKLYYEDKIIGTDIYKALKYRFS